MRILYEISLRESCIKYVKRMITKETTKTYIGGY